MTSLKTHLLNMLAAGLKHEMAKAEHIGLTQKFSSPEYQHQVQARCLPLKLAADRIAKRNFSHTA